MINMVMPELVVLQVAAVLEREIGWGKRVAPLQFAGFEAGERRERERSDGLPFRPN